MIGVEICRVCVHRYCIHEIQGEYMHHLKSINLIFYISSLIATRKDGVSKRVLLSNSSFWFPKETNQRKPDFLKYDA